MGDYIVVISLSKSHENNFTISFSIEGINSLFKYKYLKLKDKRFLIRREYKHWVPCDMKETSGISNI